MEEEMPTYEYKCNECEHVFEELQSINAEPVATCPECGGTVQRLIGGGAGLIFKGSGFYLTDYKNNKNGSSASSGTNGHSGDAKKKETSNSSKAKE